MVSFPFASSSPNVYLIGMSIRSVLIASAAILASAASLGAQAPIKITADLSEAPRRLYHAEVDIPVKPGPVTLTTPKWIPGNHRPTGPVDNITGVVFTANGETLKWRRDDVDLYQFHVIVPKGVTNIHAHLDAIALDRVSDHLVCLEWERLLLYPANVTTKDLPIEPSVIVPAGWGTGTALQPISTGAPSAATGVNEQYHQPTPGSVVTHYALTNVEQLQDSPVIAGQYFHEFALAPELPVKHYIDVVADQPGDQDLSPEYIARISNLVREANAAYGSHHYNVYHFLLTLSDVAGGEGLEHGQSSDNGENEKAFASIDRNPEADLLPHEYTHSWNGKYRRPARLNQPTFATPEQGDLLWVYEGMTQYMGNVLGARSGLVSKQEYLDTIANDAASMDFRAGRDWRSTEDTAISASVLRGGDPQWSNWKRGQDYYIEGLIVWLDVDTKIRQLTNNQKSITDFQKLFLGKGGNTGPEIVGYELSEIVSELNSVAPYDWNKFFQEKVNSVNEHADLDGITQGGYKLVYLDHPAHPEGGRGFGGPNVWYSLGLRIGGGRAGANPGVIADVRYGGPADAAKLYPGQQIIAINGQSYSADALTSAIKNAVGKTEPIHLVISHEGTVSNYDINYHDGEKYPTLVRVDGTPDYIMDIATPLTKTEHAPGYKERTRPDSN